MKKSKIAIGALMALAATVVTQAGAKEPSEVGRVVPGQILVMPNAGLGDEAFAKVLKEHGASKGKKLGKDGVQLIQVPAGEEIKALAKLKASPHVKFAELDRAVPISMIPTDPNFGSQWHLATIGAPSAWDSATGGGVTIAICDSGVNAQHPDLAARVVPGWNFFDGNSDTQDVRGHGTPVAGTAAAIMNNGVGVAGVAGGATIMPMRISGLDGWASFSAMVSCINWASDHGARVVNISFGGVAGSASVQSAAAAFKAKGGLTFISAGNGNIDEGFAPSASLIVVSATGSGDVRTSWSSFGSFVSLSAPGEGIYTTGMGGDYRYASGTSFSSPLTAGVAALVMSRRPDLAAKDVETILFKSAVDLGAPGRDIYYGYGRVDAAAAMAMAASYTSTADTLPPMVAIGSPAASSTVSGLVAISAQASDNTGVARVDLLVNGVKYASDSSAPFAFSWDSTKVANGMVNLSLVAADAAGNTATSAVIAVNVANVPDTTAPSVMITSPASGAVLSGGSVTLSASANDSAGVARVEFLVDGVVIGSDTGSPFSVKWNLRKVAPGSKVITAKAYDKSGNSSSQSVTVQVR